MSATATSETKHVKHNAIYDAFNIGYDGFGDPIEWAEDTGVSFLKRMPNGFASLYKIGVDEKRIGSKDTLSVSVSYGKESDRGISIGESRFFDPVDLTSHEFSYDPKTAEFSFRDKKVTPRQILTAIEDAHMRPTYPITGLPLRTRIWFWRIVIPSLIKFVDQSLIWLLWAISGDWVVDSIIHRLWESRGVEDKRLPPLARTPNVPGPKLIAGESINFFGYQARRWSVIVFCGLNLLAFLIYRARELNWNVVHEIGQNSLLLLCYAVVAFSVVEAGIPGALRYLIVNYLPKLYWNRIGFSRISVKIRL